MAPWVVALTFSFRRDVKESTDELSQNVMQSLLIKIISGWCGAFQRSYYIYFLCAWFLGPTRLEGTCCESVPGLGTGWPGLGHTLLVTPSLWPLWLGVPRVFLGRADLTLLSEEARGGWLGQTSLVQQGQSHVASHTDASLK